MSNGDYTQYQNMKREQSGLWEVTLESLLVANVWQYDSHKVKLKHFYFILIELKIYQHYNASARDVPEYKYSDGRQVGRKEKESEIRRPIRTLLNIFKQQNDSNGKKK